MYIFLMFIKKSFCVHFGEICELHKVRAIYHSAEEVILWSLSNRIFIFKQLIPPSGSGVKTEVVDLSDQSKSCLVEDIPFRDDSAGGML